jgi:hypothetical protein
LEGKLDFLKGLILEELEARPKLYLVVVLSGAAAGTMLYLFGVTLPWFSGLAILGFVTAFAIDWITAWHGEYNDLRMWFLFAALGLDFVATLLVGSLIWLSVTQGFTLAIASFFLAGLPMGFEAAYVRARTVLRIFRGLRVSGDIKEATVAAAIPAALASFGPDVLEHRLALELEDAVEVEEDASVTHTPKGETNFGFNIATMGETRVLFRIENGLAETLIVPLDGIVARFELADEDVPRIRFALVNILHFAEPTAEQSQVVRGDIDVLFGLYGGPTLDLKAKAVARFLLALLIGILGTLAILNVNRAIEFLSEPRVNTSLASLAYILAIIGVMFGVFRWIKRGKKPPTA